MARIERFEDLEVCREAVAIGVDGYQLTSKGILEKDFSTRDQLRRAAISISNSIAEGFEYNNNKVFVKFLGYAKASAGELRSNLLVLHAANVLSTEEVEMLQNKLLQILKSISASLNT